MNGRVLIVAGSDSGGGAGIQADIKTVTALGGFAMTAITALTAQNTVGVHGIHEIPADFVSKQMEIVFEDLGADCVKIGMLHRPDIIDAVVGALDKYAQGIPIVVDPVMIAKGGESLLEEAAMTALKERVIPKADILTPNLPEAEALANRQGNSAVDAEALAQTLLELGPKAVLLKGGHRDGPTVLDLLMSVSGTVQTFENARIETVHTHGTGCTLASAIATGLAQNLELATAVSRGHNYVLEAIRTAPGYGNGHGPLNHGHTVTAFNEHGPCG